MFIGLIVGFAVCLNSCSAVSTLKGYSSLCLPFALLACLLLLMFTNVEKNNTALTGGLLVFVLPVVFSALANFDNSNVVNSLTLLSCIFLAYLCVRKFGSILMCRIFVKLMCISAAMSLILYLATNLLRLNLPFPVLETLMEFITKPSSLFLSMLKHILMAVKVWGFSGKAVFLLPICFLLLRLNSWSRKKHRSEGWPCSLLRCLQPALRLVI